jgi:hypothetical protein
MPHGHSRDSRKEHFWRDVLRRWGESVLEVYHWPFDPKRPLVRMDECSKQLIG